MSVASGPTAGALGSDRNKPHQRDQEASPFSLILDDLIRAQPFVRAAAIFDFEGETVDYAGRIDPYELRVAAATFQMVVAELRECPILSATREIAITMRGSGYLLRPLDESYSLLLQLRKLGTFSTSKRVLHEIDARIRAEAGLAAGAPPEWFQVAVELGAKGRPERIRPVARSERTYGVEVLGSVMGLADRERGYRVRLDTGAELTLLRERKHLWFVDESLDPALVQTHAIEMFRARDRR
ncbi:MAG TPA: hypothetical protein VL400_08095 [Polyangiaceae bacterium]|nr:hypothetical protein [Polyangiaceae bacterium]